MRADQSGIGSYAVGVPGLEGSIRGGRHDLKGTNEGDRQRGVGVLLTRLSMVAQQDVIYPV